jgi:ADP-ribose pyrophosphatase YjhB (NUDIX family)
LTVTYHPARDDQGRRVPIHRPTTPSTTQRWDDPREVVTVVPGMAVTGAPGGIALSPWRDAPVTTAGWAAVPGQRPDLVLAPPASKPHLKQAAGVVAIEPDGRAWLVSPTNRHGGYVTTFPKGTLDPGLDYQATAIKEGFEESGLRFEIIDFCIDIARTTSMSRYFWARRVGGDPSRMGWESQAVHLVPRALLSRYVTHASDRPLLELLLARL